jgi:uncharacterized membrane protein
MPSLSEIHGLLVHLPLLAVPVLALLVTLERLDRGGDLVRRTQPWVLGAGAAGAVVAVLSGLLVLGGAQQTLRGSTGKLVWIHLGLGVALALSLLLLVWIWWRAGGLSATPAFGARAGIAATALVLTVAVGFVGGKMVYAQGVGVHAGGQFAQTARGASLLAAGLATNADRLALGKQAYQTGLGCGSCHGMEAQGGSAPALAGGVELEGFRGTHGNGLFPANVVTDPMFQVVDDWLKTLADHPAATEG